MYDVPAASAILDRLLHHAEVVAISGRSYRIQRVTKPSKSSHLGAPPQLSPAHRATPLTLRSIKFKLKSGINRGPLRATPIYSVLSLSSPPLRAERVTIFCFRLFRSLVPRSQKSKTKMGWKTYPNFVRLGCYIPLAERLLLCLFRSDRISNHESLLTNHF